MLFDTHAHFNDKRFKDDRDEAIKKAYESGVSYILNVSYNIPSLEQSISLSRKYSYIYAAVGIHPHYSKEMNDEVLEKVRSLAKNNKVVGIGEIGLDYYRDLSPREVQKDCFVRQIDLAKEIKLPIIVHIRDANEDALKVLKDENAREVGGIIHSFSGDINMAREVMENNFYISVGGPVTYRNAGKLIDVVKYVPLDRLLIETDCPYLTPEPFRGNRNDSSLVRLVAEKIAEIKDKTFDEIAEITTNNAKRLFKIWHD
ncbi:TatD family hydrolase [Pseudobacteroides cellulosolvens]|uniref:Hydrolase, TatD family n=1 Tax=Pseudobacteroides cellulosolvens ATCC 35603 = DSM 2933 TaxID=398512 RepID=A0A0L6JTY1_9FIRM|nr:TatD family hydrolase [Pseudobacteroides cellulosolvens]KNY29184.1 hydrolase, TatD family [Pseudobacteroides cellulosolvens ATCC 35603 = DSM 2933]